MSVPEKKVPNPGSEEAARLGCTCPVIDNHYGRGYHGKEGVFVYNMECKVHGGIRGKGAEDKS